MATVYDAPPRVDSGPLRTKYEPRGYTTCAMLTESQWADLTEWFDDMSDLVPRFTRKTVITIASRYKLPEHMRAFGWKRCPLGPSLIDINSVEEVTRQLGISFAIRDEVTDKEMRRNYNAPIVAQWLRENPLASQFTFSNVLRLVDSREIPEWMGDADIDSCAAVGVDRQTLVQALIDTGITLPEKAKTLRAIRKEYEATDAE